MSTCLDIVNRALRLLCVSATNESANGPEGHDALDVLNNILDQWSNEKLLNFYMLNETFNVSANVGTYSIGPQTQVITDNAGTFTAGYIGVTINGVVNNEYYDGLSKDSTMTALAAHLVSLWPEKIKSATYSAAAHTITLVPTGYAKLTVSADTTYVTGTMTVTVAASGSNWFDTLRPLKIESVFLRDPTAGYNNDYFLEIIPNDRYELIFQKGILTTYPKYVNYVPTFPAGQIRLWPIPTRDYVLGISQWPQLARFNLLSDSLELPPGYEMALGYWLAYEMAPEYGKDPKAFYTQAMDKKAALMRTNIEPILMSVDTALIPKRSYNIYSDRY